MNENIDLTKILKDCPKGTKLYSTIFGEVEFRKIEEESNYPIVCVSIACNNCDVTADGRYYDAFSGECILFPSREQRDWSKFTAPWYKKEGDTISCLEKQGEQEEPQVYETEDGEIITYSETDGYKFVEPNFHEGDWVVNKFGYSWHIDSLYKKNYQVSDGKGNYNYFPISKQDEMHLWTIKDANDCDVLVNGSNIFIFNFINNRRLMGYCHVNMDDGNFYNDIGRNECFCTIDAPVTPATKEQHDAMMKAMNDAGYKWNAKTKTLEKLSEPKFDPKTLQPFDRVLARIDGGNAYCWFADFVSTPTIEKYDLLPCIMSNKDANMIIPYNEETRHLVGTTEEAPEYYRYWED